MNAKTLTLALIFVGTLLSGSAMADEWPIGPIYLDSNSATMTMAPRVVVHPEVIDSYRGYVGLNDLHFAANDTQVQKPAQVEMDSTQIALMQKVFVEQGYRNPISGVLDGKTLCAIYDFQVEHGLAKTGYPTLETLKAVSVNSITSNYLHLLAVSE